VGDSIAGIFGMGDYRVQGNSILKAPTDVPMFRKDSDGITFSYKEFITDVIGTSSFSLSDYRINPGVYATFPLLSVIAQGFEEYEFEGLVFAYKPLSGSAIASTNNTLGDVILATEYDVSRPRFANKLDMLEYEYSNDGVASKAFMHPVECNPKRDTVNSRYVSSGLRTQAASTSQYGGNFSYGTGNSVANNLVDLGRFSIATVGMQASTTVGEVWASYTVRLRKPRSIPLGQRGALYHICNSGTAIGSSVPLQNAVVVSDSTSAFASIGHSDNTIFIDNVPIGTVINVTAALSCSSITTSSGVSFLNGLTAYNRYFVNGSTGVGTTYQVLGSGGASGNFVSVASFISTNINCSFRVPTIDTGTGTVNYDVQVIAVPLLRDGTQLTTGDELINELTARLKLLEVKLNKYTPDGWESDYEDEVKDDLSGQKVLATKRVPRQSRDF